jgi:fermentation-respiration switch protein FrsA (DUF1100 family)
MRYTQDRRRQPMQKISDYFKYRLARFKSGQWKKDMFDTLFYLLQGYLMAVALIIACQRMIMYYPSAEWLHKPAPGIEVVTYTTTDNISLTSWYAPPQKGKPVLVVFHGNGGNISLRDFKQDFFAQQGYGFLLAEYRGYGGNKGRPSEEGFYNDARAAITWLGKTKGIAPEQIILWGESIGTGVASEMAIEYKNVKALVLEAPLTSATDMANHAYPWLTPFTYLTLDKYNNMAKAPYFAMPVLVINGSKDGVIPTEQGKKLFAAVGTPHKKLVVLEGGNHNNLAEFGLLQEIQKFIDHLPTL